MNIPINYDPLHENFASEPLIIIQTMNSLKNPSLTINLISQNSNWILIVSKQCIQKFQAILWTQETKVVLSRENTNSLATIKVLLKIQLLRTKFQFDKMLEFKIRKLWTNTVTLLKVTIARTLITHLIIEYGYCYCIKWKMFYLIRQNVWQYTKMVVFH